MTDSQVPDSLIGQHLVQHGWKQGALLLSDALLDAPLRLDGTVVLGAIRTPVRGCSLVIASQTCDINAPFSKEPAVEALCCYSDDPAKAAHYVNSARLFTIDERRGLVAQAAERVLINKHVLAELTPLPWPSQPDRLQMFRRWLGGRFQRADIPDAVDRGFARHLRKVLDGAKAKQSAEWAAYNRVVIQVWVNFPNGEENIPVTVEVRVLRKRRVTSADLDVVDSMMAQAYAKSDPKSVILLPHDFTTPVDMSLLESWRFKPLNLDDLSYEGSWANDTMPGLLA